jgi:hypothetical protein
MGKKIPGMRSPGSLTDTQQHSTGHPIGFSGECPIDV